MTRSWEAGTQYNLGDVVEYNGHKYQIIQPHHSQSDWAPDRTPALWGRKSDDHHDGHHGHHQPEHHNQGDHHHQQQGQRHEQQQQSFEKPQNRYSPPPVENKTEISHEERKKPWYDLSDDRKQQLEIGGGLLAGAAVIGAGYFAYKEHEKNDEEKKAQAWALQNWLHDAEARTTEFRQNGPRGPATWILNQGNNIPSNAIEVGKESAGSLYIARAYHEGSIQVGKASNGFKKGAIIGFDNEEIELPTYEILVGNLQGLRWVSQSGKLNISSLGYKPVDGGRDVDGTPLFIAKAPHNGADHPGKCSEKLKAAYIGYGGKEKEISEYQVLCYA